MKLSASNIGWEAADDERVSEALHMRGYLGLEIAPTRLVPAPPYENIEQASALAGQLLERYGLCIPSMQSIWYGRSEKVFGSPQERETLAEYTCRAVDFACAVGCPSLVFGCPKNRSIPQGGQEGVAIDFFKQIGAYAAQHGCVIALEANPPVYGTNFMNTTSEAFRVAGLCGEGIAVNFDLGTLLTNGETLAPLAENLHKVSHIHISEPGLAPIEKRPVHRELAALLRAQGYGGFVSVEMKAQPYEVVCEVLDYVAEVFG